MKNKILQQLIDLRKLIILKHNNHYPLDIDSCEYICKLINDNNLETCLEIGTGLGFSSLYFSLFSSIKSIDTIEKNKEYFLEAIKQHYTNKVNYINMDAFHFTTSKKYDLIFIDGPKSNQILLFDIVSKYLTPNGYLVIDNIFLNRLKNKDKEKNIKIINKVNDFKQYLLSLPNIEVNIVDIGDGLAVIKRK